MNTSVKAVTVRLPLDLYNALHDQAEKRLLSDNAYIVHTLQVLQNERILADNAYIVHSLKILQNEKRRKANIGTKAKSSNE